MTITTRPRTIGELRESGYRVLSVKEELRKNLIQRIRKGEVLFPGIIGYEETVIPQIENAVLSGQDIIFLGERGQGVDLLLAGLGQRLRRDGFVPVGQVLTGVPVGVLPLGRKSLPGLAQGGRRGGLFSGGNGL